MNKDMYEKQIGDFVGAGFHKLDEKILTLRPPKIQWGLIYRDWDDKKKIEYLEKLASSMNHAAALIQDERNQLNALMAKKEEQLVAMNKAIEQNNAMLQSEIGRMNAEKQEYNEAIAVLNRRIKELEKCPS